MSQTFVIIKPDAQERGFVGKILSRFEDKFLRVVGCQLRWKSETWARAHYSHLHDETLERNVQFMTAGPLLGVVLAGNGDVIKTVRALVGPTFLAGPGTIRGDYETVLPYNLIHALDSNENYDNEIKAFFNPGTDRVDPTSPSDDSSGR